MVKSNIMVNDRVGDIQSSLTTRTSGLIKACVQPHPDEACDTETALLVQYSKHQRPEHTIKRPDFVVSDEEILHRPACCQICGASLALFIQLQTHMGRSHRTTMSWGNNVWTRTTARTPCPLKEPDSRPYADCDSSSSALLQTMHTLGKKKEDSLLTQTTALTSADKQCCYLTNCIISEPGLTETALTACGRKKNIKKKQTQAPAQPTELRCEMRWRGKTDWSDKLNSIRLFVSRSSSMSETIPFTPVWTYRKPK